MANQLTNPEKFFFKRFGMNEPAFERILGAALERKADTPTSTSNIATRKRSRSKNRW